MMARISGAASTPNPDAESVTNDLVTSSDKREVNSLLGHTLPGWPPDTFNASSMILEAIGRGLYPGLSLPLECISFWLTGYILE